MWNSQGQWRPSWKCHNMWHIRKMLFMLLSNSLQSLTVLTICAQWMGLAALLYGETNKQLTGHLSATRCLRPRSGHKDINWPEGKIRPGVDGLIKKNFNFDCRLQAYVRQISSFIISHIAWQNTCTLSFSRLSIMRYKEVLELYTPQKHKFSFSYTHDEL